MTDVVGRDEGVGVVRCVLMKLIWLSRLEFFVIRRIGLSVALECWSSDLVL